MQFMFVGTPKDSVLENPPSDLMEKVKGDWAQSLELFSKGTFRQLWTAGKGIVFLCEATSRQELEGEIATLPMMKAQLIDVTIFELTPYRGFTPSALTVK